MCGIVGYTGTHTATPILLEGLKRLEYRGYDSAGLAILADGGGLQVHKIQGKLARLVEALGDDVPPGRLGIGHTRWATHGVPSDGNAHPHLDCTGRLALVHNGIIENYVELKRQLEARGHTMRSQTDTEIVVHLVEEAYRRLRQDGGAPPEEALPQAARLALQQVTGSYALVLAHADAPDLLVGARQHSPLVIGLGQGENFLASDIAAMLDRTRRAVIIEDGEVVAVSPERVHIRKLDGSSVDREPFHVPWSATQAEKGGYEHFYLKEVHEQPEALSQALADRLVGDRARVRELELLDLDRVGRMAIVACGSSYHAGLVGKRLIERWAGIPTEAWVASEFRYADPILDPATLVIPITQSGETADTLACFRLARDSGCQTLCITNVLGSSITWGADAVVYMQVGPEIGVVASKTYTAQLAILTALALQLGQRSGRLPESERREVVDALRSLPRLVARTLESEPDCQALGRAEAHRRSFFYFGRGLGFPVALEGALKLKEISYIHAEAYPAGELKHGPIAMLDPEIPVLAIATRSPTYEKVISNIQEVRARRSPVFALATEGDGEIAQHAEAVLYVPDCHEAVAPILSAVPLQLVAYYVALERGTDVDQPRNLAKSVTVE